MIKQSFIVLLLPVTMLMSASALSASTVTFQGEVTAQTCNISINNTTNAIVMMPTIPASALYTASTTGTAPGNTAGLTPFTISVSDCTSDSSALTMYPEFLGSNVDATNHALGNMASDDAASGVSIALYSDATGTSQIPLDGITPGAALTLPAGATTVSTTYSAKYIATSSTVSPGKVTGVAQYTLSYP